MGAAIPSGHMLSNTSYLGTTQLGLYVSFQIIALTSEWNGNGNGKFYYVIVHMIA